MRTLPASIPARLGSGALLLAVLAAPGCDGTHETAESVDAADSGHADTADPVDCADTDAGAGAGCMPVSLRSADATYTGEALSLSGAALSGAGDVDGDGHDDFLIGAHGRKDGDLDAAGAAYLLLGGAAQASVVLTEAPAMYAGDEAYDGVGEAVAGAGDVNADGYADLLVGAVGYHRSDGGRGAAFLVLGGVSPQSSGVEGATAVFAGESGAGASVAGVGDVDADGFADVLVGVHGYGGPGDGAYLILGSSAPESMSLALADAAYTRDSGGDVGYSLCGAGDVDADGYADMLFGAPTATHYAGAVHLVRGGPWLLTMDLSAADAVYTGEESEDLAGASLSGAGDVNADGYADILVGAGLNAQGGADAGAAYLVLGSAQPEPASLVSAVKFTGEAPGDSAGNSVAGAGDVNGDAYADLLLGAYTNGDGGPSRGAAYVILGEVAPAPRDLAEADRQYGGAEEEDAAGMATSGAGDVNADGFSDFLVGAPSNDEGGYVAGATYLLLGGAAW